MVEVTTQKYQVSPTLRWTTPDGRLTSEAQRFMRDVAQIVNAITISDGEITGDMIAAGSITADKITVGKLDAAEVLIAGSAITAVIADNAVTTLGSALTAGNSSVAANDTEVTIQSVTITPLAGNVKLTAQWGFQHDDGNNGSIGAVRLYRGSTLLHETAIVEVPYGVVLPPQNRLLLWADTSPGTSSVTYHLKVELESGNGAGVFSNRYLLAENSKK